MSTIKYSLQELITVASVRLFSRAHKIIEFLPYRSFDFQVDVLVAPKVDVKGLYQFDTSLNCGSPGGGFMTRKDSMLVDWWDDAFKKYVVLGGYGRLCLRMELLGRKYS